MKNPRRLLAMARQVKSCGKREIKVKHLLAGATFALTGLLPGATSDTRADLKKAQKDIAQLTVIAYAHQTTLERHERIVKDFKIRINTLEDELADMSNE